MSVERQSGVRVRYAQGEWTWWEGWVFRDLTIERPRTKVSSVQLSRFAVRPSLLGLWRRPPLPLTFSANVYGGTLSGSIHRTATGLDTQFAVQNIVVEQAPLPPPWGQGGVSGNLTVEGAFQGNPADARSLQGTWSATLTNGAVRAGTIAKLPRLALQAGQVHMRATLIGKQLEIAECRLIADGVGADVQGKVMLRTPVEQSGLDLRVNAQMMEGTPPSALTALIAFLPSSSPGAKERNVLITGSAAAPIIKRRE